MQREYSRNIGWFCVWNRNATATTPCSHVARRVKTAAGERNPAPTDQHQQPASQQNHARRLGEKNECLASRIFQAGHNLHEAAVPVECADETIAVRILGGQIAGVAVLDDRADSR